MQLNETNPPFNKEQLALINQLLPTLSSSQQQWLGSYLLNPEEQDGHTTSSGATADSTPESTTTAEPLEVNILFGTETGNAEEVAEQFEAKLKEHNLNVHLSEMDDFPLDELTNIDYLFIICSTQGVGEPPINAIDFHEFMHSDKAPQLDGLNFSVLALGDESYPDFCQAGRDFNEIFGKLGGHRLAERVDCDFDFEEVAE
ncbi:MAG: flavodoxin domain-containing protein, partial [Staphylococcus equorum]|nr:flavodoxin domain-containing protein [Staphylococcus equorum]